MGNPVLLRSYTTTTAAPGTNSSSPNPTILQAARATTAAPGYFKAQLIGPERYVNSGVWCNNPVRYVFGEGLSIFPGEKITVILSLGTGRKHPIDLQEPSLNPKGLINALKRLAMNTEREHEVMESILRYAQQFEPTQPLYTRLSVDVGLEDIGLDDWRQLDKITRDTTTYLNEPGVANELEKLANEYNKTHSKSQESDETERIMEMRDLDSGPSESTIINYYTLSRNDDTMLHYLMSFRLQHQIPPTSDNREL